MEHEISEPATGRLITTIPARGADEVAAAAARGREAQAGWEALGFAGRTDVLRRIRRRLIADADRVMDVIVSETGKAREDAWLAEITYTAAALDFWARRARGYLADERVRTRSPLVRGKRLVVRWRPVGLVGVIGPWNYPLSNSFGDCIPALAAGNAVLLKPSEVTPLTSLLIEELVRDCGVPEAVFQVVPGGGETGAAVVDASDMVMFTGSTATGRKVMARAAETLTPVSLELGGKDPLIVLADADLERAANVAVYYAMQNAGQTCLSLERIYVEAPVYERFVDLVGARVRALRHGPPGAFGSIDIGAITHAPQLELVDAHVRDAIAKGARVVAGTGRADGPGRFFLPTVLADVDHTMDCMRDETFGPVLPVMRVADADEAVRLANDSPYGLGASVFSGDRERAESIARRLHTGVASINDAFTHYAALELPMGGVKASGLGSRHGPDGIRKYCHRQALLVSRYHLRREPHMYPYKRGRSRAIRRLVELLYGR